MQIGLLLTKLAWDYGNEFLISFIMVRIMSFLVSIASAEHKESKGVVFEKIWREMRKP